MNLTGVHPQEFRIDQRSKRKRIRQQMEATASTYFKSQNYFSVLSDSDSDTETAETTPPPLSPKERIPPIVLYGYLHNHSQKLKTLNDKLSNPIDIKTKTNRLLLNTKTVVFLASVFVFMGW
jgi:hypothetical protein